MFFTDQQKVLTNQLIDLHDKGDTGIVQRPMAQLQDACVVMECVQCVVYEFLIY
jgi:hypothetical protein